MKTVTHSERATGRAYLLCVYVLVFIQTAFASNEQVVRRVTALTLEGMKHAYNFNMDSAEVKFNEAIQVDPTHPRPLVSKLTVLFWRFALGNDEKLYQELITRTDEAIEVAESYHDAQEEDADALVCLGSLYGYKAFAHARQKSYLKAAWDGKKSIDYYSEAVELNPKAYDAYLGLGCYHYFASFAPKGLQWVVNILGIEADADLGVRELRLAIEKSTYSSVEAQYYLAQFLPWQSGNFERSEAMLADLHSRFPQNSLISFTLSIWEMRRNDVASARKRLESIAEYDRGSVPGLKALALYKLAECNFRLNDFQIAMKEYKAFLSVFKDDNYRATAHFRIGLCYEFTGRRDQALKHYQAARSAERKHGDDKYSFRKAEELVAHPIAAGDSLLIVAKNIFKAGAYETAIAVYEKILSLPQASSSVKAEAMFGIGETLIEQKRFADALPHFSKTLAQDVAQEQWLIPWSHYQLGVCHSNLGNKTVAKREFTFVQEYDEDYDFKNWLGFRTERELERLK